MRSQMPIRYLFFVRDVKKGCQDPTEGFWPGLKL